MNIPILLLNLDYAQLLVQSYAAIENLLWHFTPHSATQAAYCILFSNSSAHSKPHLPIQRATLIELSVVSGEGLLLACAKENINIDIIMNIIIITFCILLFAIVFFSLDIIYVKFDRIVRV
jgi:hypothetical protein